jgi:hypothetical protein
MPLRNVEIDPDIFDEEPENTDCDSTERTAAHRRDDRKKIAVKAPLATAIRTEWSRPFIDLRVHCGDESASLLSM